MRRLRSEVMVVLALSPPTATQDCQAWPGRHSMGRSLCSGRPQQRPRAAAQAQTARQRTVRARLATPDPDGLPRLVRLVDSLPRWLAAARRRPKAMPPPPRAVHRPSFSRRACDVVSSLRWPRYTALALAAGFVAPCPMGARERTPTARSRLSAPQAIRRLRARLPAHLTHFARTIIYQCAGEPGGAPSRSLHGIRRRMLLLLHAHHPAAHAARHQDRSQPQPGAGTPHLRPGTRPFGPTHELCQPTQMTASGYFISDPARRP